MRIKTKAEIKAMPPEGQQLYKKLFYLHEREALCVLTPLQKKILVEKRKLATEEFESFGY